MISDYSSNQTVEIVAWSLAAAGIGTMGYLRMHFLTDVMAGFVVGAAVPQLHKTRRESRVSINPTTA